MALTFIAIVLLAAAWAALLLPDLRGRTPSRRSDSIAKFNRQLSTIERARPGHQPSARVVAFPQRAGAPVPPAPRATSAIAPRSSLQARQRRQNVLLALAAGALVTLAAGVMISPYFFALHLLVDVALGGFVWVLVQHRNQTAVARRRVVRDVDAAPVARRRAASS